MSNSTGAAGQPHYDDNYGFDLGADLNEVSDYAAGLVLSGSWTPQLGGGGGATLGTNSDAGGFYTRSGVQGRMNGRFVLGGGCSLGTNTPAIGGLPFNLASGIAVGHGWYQKHSDSSLIPLLLFPSNATSTPGMFIFGVTSAGVTRLSALVTAAQQDTLAFVIDGTAG